MRNVSEPTQDEIRRVLGNLRVRKHVNEKNGPHAIADCHACGKESHLYVNEATGFWNCVRCEVSGGLWTLATALGMKLRDKKQSITTSKELTKNSALGRTRDAQVYGHTITLESIQAASAKMFDPSNVNGAKALAYLRSRGFDDETLRRFLICPMVMREGASSELGVGIPYVEGIKVPLVKMRNLATDKDKRKFQRSKGSHSGLFNVDGIRDCKQVVLCEGELDAVSLWQLGVTNAASTSLGAKKTLPPEWALALADAEDIVLFYDNDEAGDEATQGLMEALGTHRCRVVTIPDDVVEEAKKFLGHAPKDANDLLRAGIPREVMADIIKGAKGAINANLVTQDAWADPLSNELASGAASLGASIPWKNVQARMGGIRPGELTLVTGHTGHGKTTWLGEFAEKLAAAHMEPILKISLENGPLSEVRKSFQRKLGFPISQIITDAQREMALMTLGRLNEHPVYLLDKQGCTPLSFICDQITYARYRLNVRTVFFDHLNFLDFNPGEDEHRQIADAMRRLKTLAVTLQVHIFVVAHPRGSIEESTIPSHETAKGSSDIKQIVDNSLTVFRARDVVGDGVTRKVQLKEANGRKLELSMTPKTCFVWFTKVRHDDADCGMAAFTFDQRRLEYTPTTLDGKAFEAEAEAPSASPQHQHQHVRTEPRDPFEDEG